MNAQILGMGHALPPGILTNQDLEKLVDTTDQWIVERTGIHQRRIVNEETCTSDLCFEAANMALEKAGISGADLDLIIVATVTPDMIFPATACILQEKLGATKAAAFDLEAACTGFIYGITVAEKFLLSPEYQYILVIGAETLSKITDYTDRNTSILFGDGAGAAVIGKGTSSSGILTTYLGSDGGGADLLKLQAGGSYKPATTETVNERLHYIKMNGHEIFRFASRIMGHICDELLSRCNLDYSDLDLFVPHQANLRIIQTAMKRMHISFDKTVINLDQLGNMSSASVPAALSLAEQEGRLKAGNLVLLAGFGGGLTYGGAIIRWGRDQHEI
ncbi:MAG: beta-ketoacyl-ACP synthase III [Bacillota bacterium]|nr:beta-ketoacyl-ACP synthase III [Bacillota bacterium]